MRRFSVNVLVGLLIALVFTVPVGCRRDGGNSIDFSASVKPILNKHCITCHGGVKRNANYSLLFRQEALDTAESGLHPIIPGNAANSELIRRITSNDPEYRMPYKEAPLTKEEISILRKWIDEGAQWGDHWAYVAPRDIQPPTEEMSWRDLSTTGPDWDGNAIDLFVLRRLQEKGMTPAAPAPPAVLLRRVYMDLIGLPPNPKQAEAFISHPTSAAYEQVVDSLLGSPQFGEKWATWWLDMARYADTRGYEKDNGRTIWRYRDWVIQALNADMSFDQFTVEQLAGDLLENPTDDQMIATGFHRNTMNNDEGGTDDEEFRVAALIDRVNTTWEIWQSTTMGCVQCHTHPYDPFVNSEYYSSLAVFNNTRDEDTPGEYPNLRFYSESDRQQLDAIRSWVREISGEARANEINHFLRTLEPKFHPHDFDQFVNGALIDNKFLGIRSGGSVRLPARKLDDKVQLMMDYRTSDDGGSFEVHLDALDGDIVCRGSLPKNSGVVSFDFKPTAGTHDLYFTFKNASIRPDRAVCAVEWFAFREAFPGPRSVERQRMENAFMRLVNADVERTPVMVENGPEQHRVTRRFVRGNWMVKGDTVQPDVPRSLNPWPEDQPRNRLGFAKWLMDPANPLTARAVTNRVWEQLFGSGLVETLEDFGTQGSLPSHPELLDWLAIRLRDAHAWHLKPLIRDIVLSQTYRQDSKVDPTRLASDPTNRYLARGPRVRLTFEQVRDQALAVSGLLSYKMYGKSVMPYQPKGIWNSVYSNERWIESTGEDRYRRSVYTYIKRTSPYPAMLMFDGSSREVCVSRRIPTNTPLQALVTLNDSSFMVASRHLAGRMMKAASTPGEQIREGYQLLLVHDIDPQKLTILNQLYDYALGRYQVTPASAAPQSEVDVPPALAAMTVVANALLNLDEVITKE